MSISKSKKHPIVGNILAELQGEDWKRIRSITSPVFTSGKMRKMYPLVRQSVEGFMNTLSEYLKHKQVIDVKEMYACLTMDVIANCAFATKTNAFKDPNNAFVVNGRDVLKVSKGKDNINDESDRHESYHNNECEEELKMANKILNIKPSNKFITEDEMIAQGFVVFIAGYETASTTLSFCSYELALNPDVQQKLYEEVMSSLDTNGEIDYEVLTKLPFLDAVIAETLRLHSPIVKIGNIAAQDYRLGSTGITVQKGQTVEIPIYAIHHSEEYYPNPEMFIPDRFLPVNRHKIIPYTYLPFSAGPRNCIGMSLPEVRKQKFP
ncbi:unnamed protein product [Medioppia subpectinata]|uniref:Cytochrome P450 n=1 Tax=Medioppia subpectinata TaxID=1979941 RepID=A0A7R9KR75_9ACAR|nr:unnamed protein product [Medioppia subpectinata]CAG2108205.1 unnamed protein product [Medioppia subpectinata]